MICFKERRMTGMAWKFLNHEDQKSICSPRTKDVMYDPISTYCNLNISKHIYEHILNDYLKRLHRNNKTPVTISDLNTAYVKASQILCGHMIHCCFRREFRWLDFLRSFNLGKYLYDILTTLCQDMGYKSFFTYNLTLLQSFMSESNPLTHRVLNDSPLRPGVCIWHAVLFLVPNLYLSDAFATGAIAWSFLFLCQPSFLRIQEHFNEYFDGQGITHEMFRQTWKHFSFDRIISVTQAIFFCKAFLISYCLQRYVRSENPSPKPSYSVPPVISSPYMLLINV